MRKREKYADLAFAASLLREGKLLRAEKEIRRYLSVRPNDVQAIMLLGAVKCEAKQYRAAIPMLQRAARLAPESSEANYNLAKGLFEIGDLESARDHFVRSIEIEPDHAESHNNLGNVYFALWNNQLAVEAYKRALKIDPRCAGASFNLGLSLQKLYRSAEAVQALQVAIHQDPDNLPAHFWLGIALLERGRYRDAAKAFAHVAAKDPVHGAAASYLVYVKRMTADWKGLDALEAGVVQLVDSANTRAGEYVHPYIVAAIKDDPALSFRCARRSAPHVGRKVADNQFDATRQRDDKHRLRIAYVSGDYREHATSYLIAGLIEEHARDRFEVFGISFGPDDKSPMRRRMQKAFDVFLDVQEQSAEATAELMRKHEIDIAIDLVGFAQRRRMEIFANRAAPVQVNYLGWPGTTGLRQMDYILADPIIVPDELHEHYTEAIVHLPDCYQPNDRQRPFPATVPSRAECSLPDDAIVFCCFNNPYKIGPQTFDAWARILAEVPESVLWLINRSPEMCDNMRDQAAMRGIEGDRLVFAPQLPFADHLARFRNADIFLDTMPYNAHTTASDALWAEVPVVTCLGNTFAARVGSSIVAAAGVPELSTATLAQYERLAIDLARDRSKLSVLKARLSGARTSSPLFDPRRLCRHVEKAYETMWDKWQRRLPPSPFRVA